MFTEITTVYSENRKRQISDARTHAKHRNYTVRFAVHIATTIISRVT